MLKTRKYEWTRHNVEVISDFWRLTTVGMNYCCSFAKLCLTLCSLLDYSTPGVPVLHCLPEFAQARVH